MTAISKGTGATAGGPSSSADAGAPARSSGPTDVGDHAVCQFRLAPPRHFTYPALLLLLAEEPRHGYRLVEGLRRLGFGPVSRPSVYRALADLEGDGLLESWSAEPIAGSTRHVYGLSEAGHDQLDEWMEVVARERDGLDRVVHRFLRWRDRSSDAEVDAG